MDMLNQPIMILRVRSQFMDICREEAKLSARQASKIS